MASNDDEDDAPLHTSPHSPTVAAAPQPQTVRFASVNQEIEPAQSIPSLTNSTSDAELSSEAKDEILTLSMGLQGPQLQHRRMSIFGFEPLSLPASRVSQCLQITLLGSSFAYPSAFTLVETFYEPPMRIEFSGFGGAYTILTLSTLAKNSLLNET